MQTMPSFFDKILDEQVAVFLSQSGLSFQKETYKVVNYIVQMSKRHGWVQVKSLAQACFFGRATKRSTKLLGKRAYAFRLLRRKLPSRDIDDMGRQVVDEIVEALVKLSPGDRPSLDDDREPCVLFLLDANEVFGLLLELGEENTISRLESWVGNASLRQLERLEGIIDKVVVGKRPLTTTYSAAAGRFVVSVRERVKTIQLNDLLARYQKLTEATQNGPPSFSWSMPSAVTSCPALTAFLQSDRQGPEVIVFDGSSKDFDSLVRSTYYSRDQFRKGYCAKIEATESSGSKAAMCVTKTRVYFKALEEKYKTEKAKLEKRLKRLKDWVALSTKVVVLFITTPSRPRKRSVLQKTVRNLLKLLPIPKKPRTG